MFHLVVSRLFLPLTHKKLFVFPFTLLTSTPLCTHAHSPWLHVIPSQIHWDKKRYCLPSTFQRHLHNSNIAVLFDPNPYEYALTKKRGLGFYLVMVAYVFDVIVRHCGFCEGLDSLWVFGCLRFWFGKVIIVFCFRTKENEKEKF